jgi:putative ABC transport system permease protein
MTSLFGLSMDTIMAWMLSIFLIVTLIVAVLAVRNRLFLKLGLRNIPRRRAQTILIIIGLMLSTVIITSAFGTGDTVSYSIRNATVNNLGYLDETVQNVASARDQQTSGGVTFVAPAVQQEILHTLAGNSNVDGVTGIAAFYVPAQDLTSGQTKNQVALAGIPTSYPAAFGPLTGTDGATVSLAQLGPSEVYLNQVAAGKLAARAGDSLVLYTGTASLHLTVRAIVRTQYLAAGGLLSHGEVADPTILMPLNRLQQALGLPGAVTAMLISNRGDTTGGYAYSDGVTNQLRALLANPLQIAHARAVLATPAGQAALATLIKDSDGSLKTKLQNLRSQVALAGQSDQLKSLLSDTDVIGALESMKAPAAVGGPLNDALSSISDYYVDPIKKNGLDAADLFGSVFTTFFVAFGLFSIAAGIMLIFLIFVMLAAERRPEMGMARAIGTQRRHIIQQFLFEGYAYDLGAAVVGMLIGIGVGLGMVHIMASLIGSSDFSLVGHIEPRSLVVSFCLGALVTFITVAVSSFRVSRLNVVAAIRDLPEEFGVKTGTGHALAQTGQEFARIRKSWLRIVLWLLAIPLVALIPALGITYLVLRLLWYLRYLVIAFFARGLLPFLVGVALEPIGISTKQQIFFSLGGSLIVIGVALLLRWVLQMRGVPDPIRNRIGYSLAGVGLVIYWLLPFDFWNQFGVPVLNAGIEMFFLAGIMLVLGAVWTVMYNIDLLLGSLLAIFGGVGHLTPIIKMAVTYPTQHKLRTGLTLAMFSLVIFVLMFMSVILGSSITTLVPDRDTGNYQIYGAANPNTPIQHLQQTIAASPDLHAVIASGGMAKIAVGLRQQGQDNQSWQNYIANIVDDSYLAGTDFTLHARATGYASDAQVWQTLRSRPGYAVVDGGLLVNTPSDSSDNGFALRGAYYQDSTFAPVTIQMRDDASGKAVQLTVIGVLDQRAGVLGSFTNGVYTGQNTLQAAGISLPSLNFFVFRVAPGADVHATALALGRTFLRNGLDIKESQAEFNSAESITIGLFDLLEGFMGLGLVVGIAALGVVATRAVVERRQEIGMLRAIGFQRAMVRTTFLLESSFVAILGTLLGVGLGLALAKNLVDSVAKNNNSITLNVPWLQIVVIVVIAYVASLLTTYLPAWQASRIYPAEALRYE